MDETDKEQVVRPNNKRPRLEMDQSSSHISIEKMLSVPTEVIFRQRHDRPLLTRAEGQCLLRINILAQELDAMVSTAEKLLRQRRQSRTFRHTLDKCPNTLLRPLTILTSIFETHTTGSLQGIQSSLSTLMMELSSCCNLLRQSAEQNWSVSESLLDAMGGESSQAFARDKRNVAELEEELVKRIDILTSMTTLDYQAERKRIQESPDTISPKRNLFGKPTLNTKDRWNESLQEICSTLFDFLRQDKKPTAKRGTLHAYTQPEQFDDHGASQEAGEMDAWKARYSEVDESQNSFRNKSTAAEALAKLALEVKLN